MKTICYLLFEKERKKEEFQTFLSLSYLRDKDKVKLLLCASSLHYTGLYFLVFTIYLSETKEKRERELFHAALEIITRQLDNLQSGDEKQRPSRWFFIIEVQRPLETYWDEWEIILC